MSKLAYDPPKRTGCELREWAADNGWGPCGGGLDKHHIISRQLLRGNSEGRKLVEDVYGELFFADVCNAHNATTKCADLPEARVYLLRKRAEEHPELMEVALKEVAATFKAPPPYLRLEYLED